MSSEVLGLILLAVLLLIILGGMGIGYAMFLVGLVGMIILKGWGAVFDMAGMLPYTQIDSWAYIVFPMFILMGLFLSESGLAEELFVAAEKWVGHLPGGLPLTAVAGSTAFGACTGSTTAACLVAGKMLARRMIDAGYSRAFSTGVIAACSTLAAIIPPSLMIAFYGIIARQSIGALLIAGIIPGLILAATYFVMILGVAVFRPTIIRPNVVEANKVKVTWRERWASLSGVAIALFILAFILAGLYLGIFTPTEAGATGAFAVFVYCLARRRMGWKVLRSSLEQTVGMTVMVFVLVIGPMTFMNFMTLSGVVRAAVEWVVGLHVGPMGIMLAIYVLYLVLGMFLVSFAMVVLTIPILAPVVAGLGFDPIWFGIVVVVLAELGGITPPIGYNVFVMNSVTPDVPIPTIFKGVLPFIACDIVTVGILTVFPQIVTFLPSMMGVG
ncbi:MAG: TRAP transporter large permease [Chloroflexi bacterium]|nr:TRAP transporter large permease [Chloroflexota bacterium]